LVSTEDEGSERAIIMRYQGFIHPATLVPEELEYNKGYGARMLSKR
jgi:fructose 1,6-bisphosphate aldolase/phosphatase